ncbi:hypothetical protein E2C01_097959 [Portunus trituberculatus]|uniref:Uncharacterized protein n=1 Tax=Portunus trituberculatus TaxID=210409 RepID=A0A5B7JZZ8_PORTR|nr:hypothetical protein [Portunus trituberculatus]
MMSLTLRELTIFQVITEWPEDTYMLPIHPFFGDNGIRALWDGRSFYLGVILKIWRRHPRRRPTKFKRVPLCEDINLLLWCQEVSEGHTLAGVYENSQKTPNLTEGCKHSSRRSQTPRAAVIGDPLLPKMLGDSVAVDVGGTFRGTLSMGSSMDAR